MNLILLGIIIIIILSGIFIAIGFIKCPLDIVYLILSTKKESRVITEKTANKIIQNNNNKRSDE